MRAATAYDVSALMEYCGLALAAAAETAIRQRLPGSGGLIAIDGRGNISLPFTTEGMYRGWVDAAGQPHTAIYHEVKIWPPFTT